jgi:hypothetical protein
MHAPPRALPAPDLLGSIDHGREGGPGGGQSGAGAAAASTGSHPPMKMCDSSAAGTPSLTNPPELPLAAGAAAAAPPAPTAHFQSYGGFMYGPSYGMMPWQVRRGGTEWARRAQGPCFAPAPPPPPFRVVWVECPPLARFPIPIPRPQMASLGNGWPMPMSSALLRLPAGATPAPMWGAVPGHGYPLGPIPPWGLGATAALCTPGVSTPVGAPAPPPPPSTSGGAPSQAAPNVPAVGAARLSGPGAGGSTPVSVPQTVPNDALHAQLLYGGLAWGAAASAWPSTGECRAGLSRV